MEYLPIVQYEMEPFLKAFIPLERAIQSLSDNQLNERPVQGGKSVSELIQHIYGNRAIIFAVKQGKFEEADMKVFAAPVETLSSTEALLNYAKRVRIELKQTVDELTEEDVTRQVEFFWGEMGGVHALHMAYMELLHHRGQFQVYLRLLGIQPPDIYDVQE